MVGEPDIKKGNNNKNTMNAFVSEILPEQKIISYRLFEHHNTVMHTQIYSRSYLVKKVCAYTILNIIHVLAGTMVLIMV